MKSISDLAEELSGAYSWDRYRNGWILVARVAAKHPGSVILNTLPFDKAKEIYMGART